MNTWFGDVLFFLIETLSCRSLVSCGVSSTLNVPSFSWFLVYLYFLRQGPALSPRLACVGVIPGSLQPGPPWLRRCSHLSHPSSWDLGHAPACLANFLSCVVGMGSCDVAQMWLCFLLCVQWVFMENLCIWVGGVASWSGNCPQASFLPAQQGHEWCLHLGWCVCWPVGLSPGLQTGVLVHGLLGTGVIAGGEWRAE